MDDEKMLAAVCSSLDCHDYDRSTSKSDTAAIEAEADWVRALLAERNELRAKVAALEDRLEGSTEVMRRLV